jgi:hypothetical protein
MTQLLFLLVFLILTIAATKQFRYIPVMCTPRPWSVSSVMVDFVYGLDANRTLGKTSVIQGMHESD